MINRTFFLILVCSAATFAQNDPVSSGILYGTDHAFRLSAPSGWVLDNLTGASQDIHAVFYPSGGSWQSSPIVMYAKGSSKEPHQTIQDFMHHDSLQFVQNAPQTRIVDRAPVTLFGGKVALVREFHYSQHELIAYVDEPTIVAMIVLTSRTAEGCRGSYSAFEELLQSYLFIGENEIRVVNDFEKALAQADSNLHRPGGEAYDQAIGSSVGEWMSTEITRFSPALSDSDFAPFTVVLCISKQGKVEELGIKPQTVISDKLKGSLNAAEYPLPPAPSWWVKINVSFTEQ